FDRNGFGPEDLVSAGRRSLATVTFSDAHHVDEVGRAFTELAVADWSVAELRLALRGEAGRSILGGL
ncbi:MAG: hypothetical protein E4H09_04410, partial [Spirochaetales bacterium]